MASREFRATATFLISGGFVLIAVPLYSGVLGRTPPVAGVLFVSGLVLAAGAMVVTAVGLRNQARWARAITTPMLELTVLFGALALFNGLTHQRVDIPFGLVLGIWALRAPFRTPLVHGSAGDAAGPIGSVVLAILLAGNVLPLLAEPLTRPGGPLVLASEALQPTLTVTCEPAAGGPPTSAVVSYTWTWSGAEPWIEGTDSIVLDAWTTRADEVDAPYRFGSYDRVSPGVADADISIGGAPAVVFSVELPANRFGPGEIVIPLLAPNQLPSGHGTIDIRSRYQHLAGAALIGNADYSWQRETHAICEW
jgi:hypothetical protein